MGSVWAGAAGVPDAGGGAGGSSTSISLMTTGIGWPPSVSAQAGAELRAGIEGQDSARRQQPRVVDVVRRGDGLPRDRAAGTGDDALDRVAVLAQRQRCRTDTGGCAGTERCARAGRCASAERCARAGGCAGTERGGCADTRVRAEALARAGHARSGTPASEKKSIVWVIDSTQPKKRNVPHWKRMTGRGGPSPVSWGRVSPTNGSVRVCTETPSEVVVSNSSVMLSVADWPLCCAGVLFRVPEGLFCTPAAIPVVV